MGASALEDAVWLRLLLLLMAVLQSIFLWVRARPYGEAAHALVLVLAAAGFAAALVIGFVPASVAARFSAGLRWVAGSRRRALLVLLGVSLVAGVASVLTQQTFSWDERSVMWAADVYAEGGTDGLFARYLESAWLGPQHPPTVPMLYGTFVEMFGSRLKMVRLVNLAFGCGTVLVAFLIFEQLYERRTALVAALLLLASPLFVRVASAATNDMPLTFLFVLAVLLALRLERTSREGLAVALGLVIGLGLLVKYTMLLVFPVLLVLGLSFARMPLVRRHAPLVLALSLALLLVWLEHAYAIGILERQLERMRRLATVSTRFRGWALDAVLTKTPAALGVWVLPWIGLGLVDVLRERRTEDLFVLLWIAAVSVPLVLTLPDNRYFLPAFPAFMLLAARGLQRKPAWTPYGMVLAWVLCALTLVFYARIDLSHKVFLFR